ncbi:hypothetical protein PIB30_000279, partial [Stylosanthes scabra]|nr:hypothetical protein [Stylosanthes scabra]
MAAARRKSGNLRGYRPEWGPEGGFFPVGMGMGDKFPTRRPRGPERGIPVPDPESRKN